MNGPGRTSALLDIARRLPSDKYVAPEEIQGAKGAAIRHLRRKLGGLKFLAGRRADGSDPRKRRSRGPKRTHAQRKRERRGACP